MKKQLTVKMFKFHFCKKTVCGIMMLAFSYSIPLMAQNEVSVSYVKLTRGEAFGPSPIKIVTGSTENVKSSVRLLVYPELKKQIMTGIGAAFNEQGGEAYMSLPEKKRKELAIQLFDIKEGAGLTFCRTAIGASDFGLDAYSYCDTPEDYEMKTFSVDREKKSVIPFIQDARAVNSSLRIFASPWSPPGWMKYSGLMDKGTSFPEKNCLRNEERIYQAYALYFAKYLKAFEQEGIHIDRLLIQNEPDLHTQYPSCRMPVDQMVKLTGQFILPTFREYGITTEVWAGTFRTAGELNALEMAGKSECEKYFKGIGIQYTRPEFIGQIRQFDPDVRLMHTECVCYGGENSIEQAQNRLDEVASYILGGCDNFCYWNIALNENQKSGWGWKQNSLVVINRDSKEITYTPDYSVFSLLSRFIRPGMVHIPSFAPETSLAFMDNSTCYVFYQNKSKEAVKVVCNYGNKKQQTVLPAESLCVISFELDK